MAHGVDGPQALEPLLARASVLALGPGLGQSAWSHALWLTALDSGKPLVLDADGLNLLAREPRRLAQPAVLTPHPGEAARLLGVTAAEIERDRFAAARALALRAHAVIVLKGARTIVCDGDFCSINPTGGPELATGGSGDVLAGVIGALLAQGLTAVDAARTGVYIHGLAGEALAAEHGRRGVVSSDLPVAIAGVLRQIPRPA